MKDPHRTSLFIRVTILVLSVMTIVSCGKNLKYFTQDLYEEYGWTSKDLKKIQFYVSRDVVLYRRKSNRGTKIEGGQIKIERDRNVEEVIIKKGTPGVFVHSPKENRFAISFDNGRDQFLMFGPNSKAKGRYLLLAKDWDSTSGQVTYGGELYETSSESAYAALMVDIKKAGRTKYDSKTAGGKRIRNR
jgi:hypothetical protein